MKKFSEFLAESIRNYEYRIKTSFKPDNEMMTAIKQALEKYNLVSISSVKSLPIQRVDKDFPGLKSPETYMFDVELAYPSSENMIRHTIAGVGFAFETVMVSSPSHDDSMDKEDDSVAKNTGDGALLGKPYDPQDNAAISGENFGDEYNTKFVANAIGSTDQMIPSEMKKTKGKTLNDKEFKVGTDSAVGSKKVKKPVVKSFAR